jgi:hypothetical protein
LVSSYYNIDLFLWWFRRVRRFKRGWSYISESATGNVLVNENGQRFIPCDVTAYDYNNDFIIAVQYPQNSCFKGKDTSTYVYGKNQQYFWIIAHKSKQVYGPLELNEFERLMKLYKIDLRLKEAG